MIKEQAVLEFKQDSPYQNLLTKAKFEHSEEFYALDKLSLKALCDKVRDY